MKIPLVGYRLCLYFIILFFKRISADEAQLKAIQRTEAALKQFDSEFKRMWWLHQSAEWSYSTNITTATGEARSTVSAIFSDWMKEWKLWAREIDKDFFPASIQDRIDRIASGIVILNANEAKIISELRSNMTKSYSSATISLSTPEVTGRGEGDFSSLMSKYRDPLLLEKVWMSWRYQVGEKTRPLFWTLLKLLNSAAQDNGYENLGASWTGELGIDNVMEVALSLWNEVKAFYAHLHAYTRHKLKSFYSNTFFKDDGLIPAHLLGSLWGENWSSLIDILSPFPDEPIHDITEAFTDKCSTVFDLIKRAEDFYVKAGFPSMTRSFWKNSIFEKPKDGRLVDCHAASYDFAIQNDFRIRMCGSVKEKSFIEAVHEMGHVQYYMAYHHLPMLHRNGANSAFHEAVGETMVYAAQNPECLSLMKITDFPRVSNGAFLNNLMKQALSKFVLLPWALTVEVWRQGLLTGEIKEEEMNFKWWELRKLFQGVEPPNEESSTLFDAGSKYHIINNIPYMRYFFGRFLELQFLESLCGITKENIHSCCFTNSKLAGRHFRTMLSLGSSVSWQDALKTLTGWDTILAKPLIEYYKPLYTWLMDYNRLHNITVSL